MLMACGGAEAADVLPAEVIRAIQQSIASSGSPRAAQPTGDEIARYMHVKIDLNGDGKPEFMVQAGAPYCGSGGCLLWIYGASGAGVVRLDDGTVGLGGIDGVEVLRSSSCGYRDIMVKNQLANGELHLHTVVFDGRYYAPHISGSVHRCIQRKK
jgi:hypothetical protein